MSERAPASPLASPPADSLRLLVITTQNVFTENGARSLMRGKTQALEERGVCVKYFCMRFGGVSEEQRARAGLDIIGTGASERWLLSAGGLLSASGLAGIRRALSDFRPDWVLVSGAWLYLCGDSLGRAITASGARIAFDMQGPVEEIGEYMRVFGSRGLARLLARLLAWAEHRFLRRWTNLVETMSGNAVRYLADQRPRFTGSVCVVKCGFPRAFTESEYRAKRDLWRKKLQLDDGRLAVVFAGTLSAWQNKDALFAFARLHSETRVYFFVPRAHHAELESLGLANVRCGFLPSSDLQSALCAFDYGLLMRRAGGIANSFAFPLKASEYANARLGILVDKNESNDNSDAPSGITSGVTSGVASDGASNKISLGWLEGSLLRACVALEDFPLADLARARLSYGDLQKLEFAYMVKDLIKCYESKTRTDKTRTDKTRTDKTRTDKTRTDKTRTDKTRTDKTRTDR